MGMTWGDYGALRPAGEVACPSSQVGGITPAGLSALNEEGTPPGHAGDGAGTPPSSLSASGRAAASPNSAPHPHVPGAPDALTFMVAPVRRGPS
jgi:hypothetical protein